MVQQRLHMSVFRQLFYRNSTGEFQSMAEQNVIKSYRSKFLYILDLNSSCGKLESYDNLCSMDRKLNGLHDHSEKKISRFTQFQPQLSSQQPAAVPPVLSWNYNFTQYISSCLDQLRKTINKVGQMVSGPKIEPRTSSI